MILTHPDAILPSHPPKPVGRRAPQNTLCSPHVRPLYAASSWEELQRLADLIGQRNLQPWYNIAPTTQIEAVRPAAGGNEQVPVRSGLAPS
jgi:hypothetical protein